jgi:hypothetical protein
MTFLPEDDRTYLLEKQIVFEAKEETLPDQTIRRGVIFPTFTLGAQLYESVGGQLALCPIAKVLVLVPKGYSTTKLDSFYTSPHLKRPDGKDPDRATGSEQLFGEQWQFWSRHLADGEWRPGIDGFDTYLQYIIAELKKA